MLFISTVSLAACGGGGSSGGYSPPTGGGATPTPASSSTPTPVPSTTASPPNSAPVFPFQVSNNVVRGTFASGSTVAGAVIVSQGNDLGPRDSLVQFTDDQFNIGTGSQAAGAVRIGFARLGTPFRPALKLAASILTHDVHPLSNELAQQALMGASRGIATIRRRMTTTLPSGASVGSVANIWVEKFAIGSSSGTWAQVASTLEAQTANINVYVDNTLLSGGTASVAFQGGSLAGTVAQLQADAQAAYDSDTAHFGSPDYGTSAPAAQLVGPYCDQNGVSTGTGPELIAEPADKRINFLLLNPNNIGQGLGGYFSSANYLPQQFWNCTHGANSASPIYSNEAPMVYMAWFDSAGTTYELQEDMLRDSAHEFQHLINFVSHVVVNVSNTAEDRYINEGLSVLSQDFAVNRMFPSVPFDVYDAVTRAVYFLDNPTNYSVTGFIGTDPVAFHEPANMFNCGGGCYGSAYLFQRYLYDRCGGDAYVAKMEASSSGATGFSELQAACGGTETAQQLFTDFATAVAFASANVAAPSPRYALGTLVLNHTYAGQIGGRSSVPVGGALAAAAGANAAGSMTVPVGGFGLVQFASVPVNGLPISITDMTPTSGFTMGGNFIQH